MTVATDIEFMEMAIELARRALGRTSPNPPVGCVLVKQGRVIGSGWHHSAGSAHAEVDALSNATESLNGSTAYVTLGPCNITGRTGPCTKVLIENGVARVVVGATDPNPRVSGSGLQDLREAGIEVESGVLETRCDALIEPFRVWVTHGRPLITLKVATTLDGRIATSTRHSRWITGENARRRVHQMRDQHDAVLVGAGTLRTDNPALTTRLEDGEGRDPLRIIVSESLNLPSDAQVFAPDKVSATVVVTSDESVDSKRLVERGIRVWTVGRDAAGGADLHALAKKLGDHEITSLLIEGGSGVATGFLNAELVDRMCCFVAPRIVGSDGVPWAGELGITSISESIYLSDVQIQALGDDVCIEGRCVYGNR